LLVDQQTVRKSFGCPRRKFLARRAHYSILNK